MSCVVSERPLRSSRRPPSPVTLWPRTLPCASSSGTGPNFIPGFLQVGCAAQRADPRSRASHHHRATARGSGYPHRLGGTTMTYLERDGVKIHYEVHGQGDPVLLSHGYSATSKMWEKQVAALA